MKLLDSIVLNGITFERVDFGNEKGLIFRNDQKYMLYAMTDANFLTWVEAAKKFGVIEETKIREISDKERSMGRSEGYYGLSAEAQWDEDKRLGILDWDGR